MRIQDYVADSAREAANMAFKYAAAVPDDKLDWSPPGGGRSVLSMCRELAVTPTWTLIAYGEVEEGTGPEYWHNLERQWSTVAQCEAEFNQRFEAMDRYFRSLTDEDLKKTKWLPYNGGRDHTFLEMMDYPRWNATYHLGQIAYIQTLYGDKEMH